MLVDAGFAERVMAKGVLMNWYLRFSDRVNRAAMFLSVLFLVATVVICFIQVVTRTAMSFSFRWGEELTRYIVIYMVFFASGTLLARDEHPKVEILADYLPRTMRLRLNYVYALLIFTFLVVLCYYGWQLSATSWRTMCSSIRIPWAIPFASVFIGGANMLLQIPAMAMRNHQEIVRLAGGGTEGTA
jgi:TRAP-type C4-dicarboxylate transport system permease small subunit